MAEFQPFRPVSAFLGGMGAAQQLVSGQQDIQAKEQALETYKGRQSALASYAETGDIKSLMKYDPEMVMRLDDHKAKQMEEGIGLVYKAAPFLLQQAGNPQSWNAFGQDLKKFGVPDAIVQGFTGPGTPQEKVGRLQNVLEFANDLKAKLHERQTRTDVGAFKEKARYEYENVTVPSMKLKQTLEMGIQANAEQLKEKYSRISDKRVLFKEAMNDVTRGESYLAAERAKLLAKIEEKYAFMGPSKDGRITQEMIDDQKQREISQVMESQEAARRQLYDTVKGIAQAGGAYFPDMPKQETGRQSGGAGGAGVRYPVFNKRTGKTEFVTEEEYKLITGAKK